MNKAKKSFFCQECGHEVLKWLGRCPNCESWNSFVEHAAPPVGRAVAVAPEPRSLGEINDRADEEQKRMNTGYWEMDRVLGGGIMPGSLVLVGGDPGIGKSTLLLQIAAAVAERYGPVLYVTGEESLGQVSVRAQRLGFKNCNNLFLLTETDLDCIEQTTREMSPVMLVLDSIQTVIDSKLESVAGSVAQLREITRRLMNLAKQAGVTVFLIGHVTKEGVIAGPRVLEHLVDTVLYFEGEKQQYFTVLRSVKNRFGTTNEIGIFRMEDGGLKEVGNPSECFLAEKPQKTAGSVVVSSLEGTRTVLVEVQALVSGSTLAVPRRMTAGIDPNRINLILAVLDKRVGLRLGTCDAYVNVAGGIKVTEPAADLGTALALASSYKNIPVPDGTLVIGEVGLTGEVRGVTLIDKRVREASRLGFKRVILPKSSLAGLSSQDIKIELIDVTSVQEALEVGLGGR